MDTTPTTSLIRIDKGFYCGTDISNTTATLVDVDNPASGYYLLDGPHLGLHLNDGHSLNEITACRPCVAVPIGELEALRHAFMGVELNRFQNAVIKKLITHTPKEPVNEHE